MTSNNFTNLELNGLEKLYCMHGNWVTICHAAHLIGDYKVIVNNIEYVIPCLLKRHPRLRSRLHIEDYQHSLEILDYDQEYFNVNLFYSIINSNDQSWEKIIEDECNRNPYSNNGKTAFPLFHFKLILKENLFHLLLFTNHCISDGRSGYILINDFLTLATSSDLHNRTEPLNTQIIPCITQISPRPYGLLYHVIKYVSTYFYKRDIRQLNHSRIPIKIVFLPNESISFRYKPVKQKFLFSSSSSNLYSRLHEKCRSQKITLHGPLFCCLLLAIDHCFPLENSDKTYLNPYNVDLDFNMRLRLPQSPLTSETVGLCVGLGRVKLKQRYSIISTLFWTLAKECMLITQKVITNEEINLNQHLINDMLKDEQKFYSSIVDCRDGRLAEINFSNVGKYPYSCDYNNGQIQLKGLHVINNGSVYRAGVVIFVTCIGDNQLDFSIAHEIECDEKAQEFLDYFIHLVELCANSEVDITLHQLLNSVESK